MKIKMLVELDYDGERMHGGTIEGSAWFFNDMLRDDVLTLHSNDIGETIGEIKVLKILSSIYEKPKKICENCHYYDDFLGACHRYPPVYINPTTLHGYKFQFIAVDTYNWCGEFKEKEEETNENN